MAYEARTWYNDGVIPDDAPEGTVAPALDADNMNRIEEGIDCAYNKLNKNEIDILNLINEINISPKMVARTSDYEPIVEKKYDIYPSEKISILIPPEESQIFMFSSPIQLDLEGLQTTHESYNYSNLFIWNEHRFSTSYCAASYFIRIDSEDIVYTATTSYSWGAQHSAKLDFETQRKILGAENSIIEVGVRITNFSADSDLTGTVEFERWMFERYKRFKIEI